MDRNIKLNVENLTDEQVLREFVKRFECDGAVLIYMDRDAECGFGRWSNPKGKKWVDHLFKTIKSAPVPNFDIKNRSERKVL